MSKQNTFNIVRDEDVECEKAIEWYEKVAQQGDFLQKRKAFGQKYQKKASDQKYPKKAFGLKYLKKYLTKEMLYQKYLGKRIRREKQRSRARFLKSYKQNNWGMMIC